MQQIRERLEKELKNLFEGEVCRNCDASKYSCEKDAVCKDHAVKIGRKYGEKIKVLIIGKESKCKHCSVQEPENFETQNNQHYRRTYDILNYLINDVDIEEYNGYQHVSEKKLSNLHEYFALTNQYHCFFGTKAHGRKTFGNMWDSCAKIVQKEIEILDPDIIVIQEAWSTKNGAEKYIQKLLKPEENLKKVENGLYSFEHNGKTGWIIGSHHPSYNLWHQKPLKELKERLIKIKEAK